jgi:UDP-N-acetylmuramate dehydrogenase
MSHQPALTAEEPTSPAATLPEWAHGLRGRLRAQVSLAKRCWFQVGGDAQWLFIPEDETDLAHFLQQRPASLPLTIIGVGSNLLVRDGGIDGVIIRLGRGFARIEAHPDNTLFAGAAAMDVHVAQVACDHARAGLEFLSGIPGTIGGALAMNAGAYGKEIKDILIEAYALDEHGNAHTLSPNDCGFSYRHSSLPEGWIFTGALLATTAGEHASIAAAIQQINDDRSASQPINSRTGGSTFRNPDGHKAWQLVDAAGCRGLRIGGAQVSEKHCNFLINTGSATAHDLETLGNEVKRRVKEHSGIELIWEIKRIGKENHD